MVMLMTLFITVIAMVMVDIVMVYRCSRRSRVGLTAAIQCSHPLQFSFSRSSGLSVSTKPRPPFAAGLSIACKRSAQRLRDRSRLRRLGS